MNNNLSRCPTDEVLYGIYLEMEFDTFCEFFGEGRWRALREWTKRSGDRESQATRTEANTGSSQ